MNKLLKLFNHPEKDIQAIHIAGTNGKGSTLAFLQTALMENDYTVGTFSSPALDTFNEQIKLNNIPISDLKLSDLMTKVLPAVEKLDKQGDHPTEFEITVLLAILHMHQNADLVIFEAGMGGKLDSTNCLNPLLTIITNVEKDHTSFLGESYKEIALHKAGIIKPGVPLVTGRLQPDADKVIKTTAFQQKAPLYQADAEFTYHRKMQAEGFTYFMDECKIQVPALAMAGNHQLENAAVSLAALLVMKKINWKISREKTIRAIAQTTFPGRFEKLADEPVLIVDSAHNPAGIAAFIETVNNEFPHMKKHLIFAAFEDKDIAGMVSQLDCFTSITFTTFSHPRAASAESVYQLSNHGNKKLNPDWEKAITELKTEVNSDNEVIFVTGSLSFIGQVRK